MKEIYLLPGKLVACAEPSRVRTILGSCVAVALHDQSLRFSGINHYLLASPTGSPEAGKGRYGDLAIPELIRRMLELGSRTFALTAKIYGGGEVLDDVRIGRGVGRGNVEVARKLLGEAGIPIIFEDVGGDRGRKLVLLSESFEIEHKLLQGRSAA